MKKILVPYQELFENVSNPGIGGYPIPDALR